MNLLICLSSIYAVVLEQCDLASYEGLVLSKFYRETCPHCQRITPLIKEIDERLENNGIKIQVRNVECGKCNCSKDKIDAVPTIVLSKDNAELGRFRGFREYDEIVDFIVKHTDIDRNIFRTDTRTIPGKVMELKEKDFYSGFEGPWIILFYNNNKDKRRELMVELGKFYKNQLKIGEIHEDDAKQIELRYGVTSYPKIMTIYNGIMGDYQGENDLSSLIDFCDQLLAPSFKEVTLEQLDEMTKEIKLGAPIFLVFYSHLDLANSYFRKIAHEFKFRAKILKTSDKALFNKAGIYPKSKDLEKNVKDNDAVILTVFRNNIFHRYDSELSDEHELLNWIYHAHYPYITKINNDNFNTVFHGFKPALLLITHNENLIHEFESFSEKRHMGLPYGDHIYGLLDANEFSDIIGYFLPKIKLPTFVIYDQMRKKFYSENILLDKENFHEAGHRVLKKFNHNKLMIYPFESHRTRNIIIMGLVVSTIIGLIYTKKRKSYKIE